ncbi:MAG: hypothetical protein RIQ49_999 [Pseudomonadota bacterium]
MVAVAQLVESRIVIPAVVGSNPIGHPTKQLRLAVDSKFVEASPSLSLDISLMRGS